MALVDIAATAEDNILQAEDLRELIQEDLRYRDKQLLRLKDEVLDLEDFNESVALNEFTLDDFRMELAAYIEANREKLEEAPFGLYAVVPPHAEYQTIKPGAIYCLKQRIEASRQRSRQSAPALFPRLYPRRRRSSLQLHQSETGPRNLPRREPGQDGALRRPVRTFRCRNQDGEDMSRYSTLLDKAVAAIATQFGARMRRQSLCRAWRQAHRCLKQVKHAADFDLITWLVIKDKNNA
jgi:hypothetical protein